MYNPLGSIPKFGKSETPFQARKSLSIPFDLFEGSISLPMPNIEGDFSISVDRPRPDIAMDGPETFLIRLKKSGQIRHVTLPARLDFRYENGLRFAEEQGSFWVNLRNAGSKTVQAQVFMNHVQGRPEEAASFCVPLEEGPLLSLHDFVEESPFKALAEARLLGADLFLGQYGKEGGLQRLKIGPVGKGEIFSLNVGDFLSWKEGKWDKARSMKEAMGIPLARVVSFDEKSLLLEAWGNEYFRLCISSLEQIPCKTKGDDFITSVRIRSEKQISCMIEKQCFVLRVGDLVLKEENRWKVLRKLEEKEDYLQGKIGGELFVFDRIDLKGGQKILHGYLFNAGRSQMLPVNVAAHCIKKQSKRKG
jgi:hypothetical protein